MVDLLAPLLSAAEDPWVYLPLFFAFSVAATVALPIPVEVGLLNPFVPAPSLIVALAAGKAVGAVFVLRLGDRLGLRLARETLKYPRLAVLYARIEAWTRRWGYGALFGLQAIPFMTDTAPLYAFSTLHALPARRAFVAERRTELRQTLRIGPFVGVSFAAGVVRGALFLAVPLWLGWP